MRRVASTIRANGSEPTRAELSRATGLTPAQVECLLTVECTPRAMEERLSGDPDTTATVGDSIVDPAAQMAYERVLLDGIEMRRVRAVDWSGSDERERAVIQAHFRLAPNAADS